MHDKMPVQGSVGMPATEKDGEWIGEALEGVLPTEMDARVWIQEEPKEISPGRLANRFRQMGKNLIVLAAVSPLKMAGTDEKRVNYHVMTYNEVGGKIQKPNEADIARVRKTFFMRELDHHERVYEGTMGESKAYHIMTVFKQPSLVDMDD